MTNIRHILEEFMTGDQWPTLLDVQQQEDQVALTLQVGADLYWLKGHFPAQPVLPGVVQTHWAAHTAQRVFAAAVPPQRIDNLKFQNVIVPPQSVHLELVRHIAMGSIHFRYRNPELPGHIFSEGKLVF